jgi:hypothetical protein
MTPPKETFARLEKEHLLEIPSVKQYLYVIPSATAFDCSLIDNPYKAAAYLYEREIINYALEEIKSTMFSMQNA